MSNVSTTPDYSTLLEPLRVWSRAEVLGSNSPMPRTSGVYAWYFQELPHRSVPTNGCVTHNGLTLLYAGISPKETREGGRPSTQNLYSRIRYHFTGNAAGSTLRLSLGCLLGERLRIELRRVGSGNRMTFAQGEAILSGWMEDNAFVVWLAHEEPWLVEAELLRNISLPLNLDQNQHHAFHQVLSRKRREAKANARSLPIAG